VIYVLRTYIDGEEAWWGEEKVEIADGVDLALLARRWANQTVLNTEVASEYEDIEPLSTVRCEIADPSDDMSEYGAYVAAATVVRRCPYVLSDPF